MEENRKKILPQSFGKAVPTLRHGLAMLDSPQVVDGAVVRLAKYITLSMEDLTSFKDCLNRWMDLNLKKAYQMVGNACKPAIALTSVFNALRVWTDNIETTIRQDVLKKDIIKALDKLKLSADFIGEAEIDLDALHGRCYTR